MPGLLADGSIVNAATINVTINATETNEANIRITLMNTALINDTIFPAGTRSVIFTGLGEGNHSFNVTMNDSAGNSQTIALRSTVLDRTNPIVVVTSSAGTSMNIGSSTTLACTVTDANPDTMSLVVSGEGTSCSGISTCSIAYSPTSSGTKTITCTAQDKVSGSVSGNLAVTVNNVGGGSDKTTTASTPSGPGAIILGDLEADTEIVVPVKVGGVEQVVLTLEKGVQVAQVSVNALLEKPAEVPAPFGKPYAYFETKTEGFTNKDIVQSSIKFAVPKEWLAENGLKSDEVTLGVFREQHWKPLKTEHVGSDEKNEIFNANTEGFSLFAVLGIKNLELQAMQTGEVVEQKQTETPVLVSLDNAVDRSKIVKILVGVLFVLVGVVCGLLVRMHKMEKRKQRTRRFSLRKKKKRK